jgi:hypothetical protein
VAIGGTRGLQDGSSKDVCSGVGSQMNESMVKDTLNNGW